jgi:glucosylceramidase
MLAKQIPVFLLLLSTVFVFGVCKKKSGDKPGPDPPPPPPATKDIECWVSKADQSTLLQKQTGVISFTDVSNSNPSIEVDSTQKFQTIDGFGYTLTGGSAGLINQLPASDKTALLQELFGNSSNAIGISYLRVSIGASDLSASVFSYNDIPAGQTDINLANFNLSKDTIDVIPVLKQILAINPNIKILGSPWSPPVWMKDNGNSMGGSLLPQYYNVYAQYFVKYINAMQAKGIPIDAITIQNEPQYGGNNPSMVMSAMQQADFIKNHLGPAFKTAGISTKIIIWDHNCDNPNYPISILDDSVAKKFIDGSAFHLYNGSISALLSVYNAHPDKNLYFTEQWTGANGSFDGDFKWHIKNVVIGSMRNWSKVALEWNLASNSKYEPHTPGGCTECKGALTIDGAFISKNVGYYIIAQASKFVPANSVRIASNELSNLSSVAFVRPDGKKVLLVLNDGTLGITFNIKYKNRWAAVTLPAGSSGTYIW